MDYDAADIKAWVEKILTGKSRHIRKDFKPIKMEERPKCFKNQRDWEAWNYYAYSGSSPLAIKRQKEHGVLRSIPHYCVDCTKKYQSRMIREGLCAYPEVIFVWSKQYESVVDMDLGMYEYKGVRPHEVTEHMARKFKRNEKEVLEILLADKDSNG